MARPPVLHIAGAVAGAVVFILVGLLWESVAFRAGWWKYDFIATGAGVPVWYWAAGLFYGMGLTLLGRRLLRRFGSVGLVGFFLVTPLIGVAHDRVALELLEGRGIIWVGPGWTPWVADIFAWASALAVGQLAMRIVAGPPTPWRAAGS